MDSDNYETAFQKKRKKNGRIETTFRFHVMEIDFYCNGPLAVSAQLWENILPM